MDIASIIQTITVYAIPLIFAITIHETAHGYVARMCGDPTAYMLGRLTLNPIKHIDPVGTILVPGAPGANLVQAVIWAIILKILFIAGIDSDFLAQMCLAGVSCNIVLMALNLIPIPPLDGGRIVTGLLPPGMAWQYSRIEPYGMYILFALILTGTLSFFMRPFMHLGSSIVRLFL